MAQFRNRLREYFTQLREQLHASRLPPEAPAVPCPPDDEPAPPNDAGISAVYHHLPPALIDAWLAPPGYAPIQPPAPGDRPANSHRQPTTDNGQLPLA